MNVEISNKIGARFKLIVRKKNSNEAAKETDWFLNTVLNTGLNRMSVGAWVDRCCVGSGNSTPVATQVALDGFIASSTTQQANASGVNTTTAPYYWWNRTTWRFAEGVAAGNLSEVGLGWGNSNLWNRALIRDINGNPTTITVLSDEYLDVVSEVRVYPAQDFSGSFNLTDKTGGIISSHAYIGRAYISSASGNYSQIKLANISNGVSVYSGDIGATVTATPTAQIGAVSTPQVTNYPSATSARITPTFTLNVGNGNHRSLFISLFNTMLSQNCGFQMQIDPPIIKNNTQIMTYTFELSWSSYVP